MREALRLARLPMVRTSPDPRVGAVVVKNGKIVGVGCHREVGSPHAETLAILDAGWKAKGATLYVNLEPCCHFGNNPPCVNEIIRSGIKKVVVAMKDPNPLVFGKGFSKLRNSGIKVKVGPLGREAMELNESFSKYVTKKMPFVILKFAMTLDGKIATERGESRWISSKDSRKLAHELRAKVDAVMTGIGTVLKDDPMFTVRLARHRENPLKIVIDPLAKTPVSSKILNNEPGKAIIVVLRKAPRKKIQAIKDLGAEVLEMPARRGAIDLRRLMKVLASRGLTSLMIESGGGLAAKAIEHKIVDKVMMFLSPKIIGGRSAPTPVGGEGIKVLARALKLKNLKYRKVSEDLLVEGYLS